MNEIEIKAHKINDMIKKSEVYKEYNLLYNLVFEKYQFQENEIKQLQQDLVNLVYVDENKFDEKKEEYLYKKNDFYNDPLVKRFIESYDAMQNMILSLKEIIESGI
ncbi:cell fate (sporulation/competence/biofilm development) regulator YlbF (YheA/YmcA/DUF963 family) [Bacilli bacterium PM5-3]|nr:cell fate (sporulation/competence/biofilm development) regulator YlbF (YheA/YmcA/DUF963 family) [Bacilli bacterium PM5-3]